MPRFLRVITAPKQVFSDPGDRGVAVLWGMLLFEFALVYPSAVTTCVFRMVGAPGHALWSFVLAFVNYAIGPIFAAQVGGWLLYFAKDKQKGRRIDRWRAGSALSYAWMPHVLVVCVGAILMACDVRLPIFPQVRDVPLVPGSAFWWGRQAVHWLPMAVWCAIAARAILEGERAPRAQSTPESSSSPRVAQLCGLIMLAAPLATVAQVHAHWADMQPVKLGSRMPHFQVAGVNREDLDSDGLAGQVVLLNFWATWCGPCVQEMPTLQRLHQTYGERGLSLVGLNIEYDNLPAVKAFMDTRGVTLPVYADWGSRVQERFGVHTYPTSFLIDRQGIVQQIYGSPPDEAELRARVEARLAL